MITENDIIRVWPQLIEVTREYARAGLESQFAKGIEGHCEACGVYSTSLVWARNLLVCPECRGGCSARRRGRADISRGTFIGRSQVRPAIGPIRQGFSARTRFDPQALRERHVIRVPRPLLPRGHGPRRGSHEEPGPR